MQFLEFWFFKVLTTLWVVALILGLGLLIAPGRLYDLIDWVQADQDVPATIPLVSRMFGAALLALAWGSFRAWRASTWDEVGIIVELEIVFTVLASIGLLRHLLFDEYPWTVWATLIVLVLFAIAWIAAYFRK